VITLLLSGGIDSVACLNRFEFARCVHVSYGQPSEREELAAATRWADRYGLPLSHFTVGGLDLGSMLDATGEAGPRVVQARNAVLISLAANVTPRGGSVMIGAHQGDARDYPDCRAAWIAAISDTMKAAYGVTVVAPLIHESRVQILGFLERRHVEFALCWSCYTPKEPGVACGSCGSCTQGR
jgi:7-cyano-7-deazaguanine synthase